MKRVVSTILLAMLLTSMLYSAFKIMPVGAVGTIYIRADGSINPPTAPIQRDGTVYTLVDNINGSSIVVERSNIVVDGAGYTLQGSGSDNGFYWSYINNVTIKDANIKNFGYGIWLSYSLNNSISGNNITANNLGIELNSSSSNSISGNNITANNGYGIGVQYSSNNSIFHSNFINNAQQAYSTDSVNVWDDGYPSGGNYWSDYTGTDVFSGSYQNETGSDGMGDTPYIIDGQNLDHYPLTVHNVAITDVLSKTVVCQNCSAQIDVAFTNEGNYAETSDVTVYANTTVIAIFTDIALANKESTTLTFDWDTTGFAKETYIIWAYVDPVAGEMETADNTYIGSGITISMQGDINADKIVNIIDIVRVALAFGAVPANPNWDPNADINGDEVINIIDIVIVALHFGETG